MAKNVIMPKFGMDQETGTVVRWLKEPGAQVTKGEPLLEVETDKVNMEVEAPTSGELTQVSAQPGEVVPIGQVIVVILGAGESAERAPATPPVNAGHKATPVAANIALRPWRVVGNAGAGSRWAAYHPQRCGELSRQPVDRVRLCRPGRLRLCPPRTATAGALVKASH